MVALPTQLGGLGIINPSLMSSHHYTTSINVTSALANLVITRATSMAPDLGIQQFEEKNLARNQHKAMETASVIELLAMLPAKQKRSVETASEKGASSWLGALPIARHGFALHKSAFRDAICLRYAGLATCFITITLHMWLHLYCGACHESCQEAFLKFDTMKCET